MKTIKGPAIFLAQFLGKDPPFDTLDNLAKWTASLGYKGVQIPCDSRLIDLELAATSDDYCQELLGILETYNVNLTELSTHLQGQLIAVHPAYDRVFDSFAPPALHGRSQERQRWATEQIMLAAYASRRLGLTAHATFSGALAWPYFYPWPQRPTGLIEEAFAELGKRWSPILDCFEENGVDCAYELHPGEDLHDGVTFERFLETVKNHPRASILYDPSHFVLQQLDYLAFLDIYHSRIKCFHVKDAEFRPNGRAGVYGGYQNWTERPGRFRSLGDGQIDFIQVFSKLAQYDYSGWAVLEWECALKHPEDGAREGASFIRNHIIRTTPRPFDNFAMTESGEVLNKSLMGL